MLFFGKKRKKEQELDEAFAKVYQEIDEIDDWNDPQRIEHYILDSCEQIVSLTKEIEGEKKEYRDVSAYLKDIQSFEALPKERMDAIKEASSNIEQLLVAREAYENTEFHISDEQYQLMEQNEDEVPQTIHRMLENERYLDKVRREKNSLEGQKHQWEIERDLIKKERKILKKAGIAIFAFYTMMLILFLVIGFMSDFDMNLAFLILFFVGALGGFLIYVRSLMLQKKQKMALRKQNQAINLLNVVCMKYANVTKAIAYTKDKYQVANSTELNFLWDQYTLSVREKERYMRNNDDLEFFNARLLRLLNLINLHDPKYWQGQTKVFLNPEEMTETKKTFVKRRQKIRSHIEDNRRMVKSERNEIDAMMKEHEYYVPEIMEIIASVDKLCGLDTN